MGSKRKAPRVDVVSTEPETVARVRGGPNNKDVGIRVRIRRVELGMSQAALGAALGVTFQQIQKYEKGTNRISAGQLEILATALKVKVGYFFAGDKKSRDARELMVTADVKYNMRLLRAYNAIVDMGVKHRLVALMETIAGVENQPVQE